MSIKYFFYIIIAVSVRMACYSQTNDSVTNYLNFPKTLNFENKVYSLNSSSHPSPNQYKLDYIILSDTNANFNTKIYFEVLLDNMSIPDILNKKIENIEKQKENNCFVDHDIYRKDGAFILHFIIGKFSEDKQSAVSLSRCVNLIKNFRDKTTGKEGILLFGFSANSTGEDYDDPKTVINSMGNYILKDVAAFNIPDVSLIK